MKREFNSLLKKKLMEHSLLWIKPLCKVLDRSDEMINPQSTQAIDLEEDMNEELGFLKDIFISNGCPVKKVDKIFETYQPSLDEEKEKQEEEYSSLSIPYIQTL
eukprot:CAMPEP_0117886524 /NCGR_PEP_ID=MMETSP0950-20121206/20419_1 /TAXON_ID=44440 /ORGANISM="Chattonella subsalsa, Strain CCMP2191" /LENGTH=103 /DNA_ID=CAMNT_0005743883 /DNA_START=102 /DNA_END=414 /DNA_ORIENTATION=-